MSTRVVRAAIHPAIGVARVGNATDACFIGPEVVNPLPEPPGFYRDASGAIKRQAARFRIYGYDAEGNVVGELTAAEADIHWSVHVANQKAAWYQWAIALDIPEAKGSVLPRRNATVLGSDRSGLIIDPGPCTIEGRNAAAVSLDGSFQGTLVNLGELRTDESGRLLVLAGHGVSASPTGQPIFDDKDPNAFINANGWYDDICDGPISATVRIGGSEIPVDPAWVLTAPPNYGPGTFGVRTLYDLLLDVFTDAGWLKKPSQPASFRHDVYPILQRLSGLQWVNRGFAVQFGPEGPYNFDDPELLKKLSHAPKHDHEDQYGELRRQILNTFRLPKPKDGNQLPWPWIYGDGMQSPAAQTPQQNASISQGQYAILLNWANGNFQADWHESPETPHTLMEVPLSDQPAMLDRAALEWCLADAFHPGCEVTWPIRHASLFRAPFRILQRPPSQPEPDLGPALTPELVMTIDGPLYGQGPGSLTRWMGLPWQADTAFCRSGYDSDYDPYVPTFWPARVPNQVLTEEQYALVMDPSAPVEKRLAAFQARASWTRGLSPGKDNTGKAMLEMVHLYGSLGLLEARPGPNDLPGVPRRLWVETLGPGYPPAQTLLTGTQQPEASAEERKAWPLPVRHPNQE
jgi:L-Lysine epsilon oxidase N-terminal/L-lysine epsilon oxidase C-terminal domain